MSSHDGIMGIISTLLSFKQLKKKSEEEKTYEAIVFIHYRAENVELLSLRAGAKSSELNSPSSV